MAIDIEPDDGARLLARGAPIHLKDGIHHLVLDYEALEFLEERFGGLDEFVAALREKRMKMNRLRNIRMGITAGLLHERTLTQAALLQPLEEFEASIVQKLDASRLVDYLDALTRGIMEAFPTQAKDDAGPKGKGSYGSPGNGSTTSQRSGTNGRPRSSGV